MELRLATSEDAARLAELHVTRITEGFLSFIGTRFLTRLYRRIVRSTDGFAVVAVHGDHVVGFSAGVADLSALYRSFMIRDGLVAASLATPRLLRSWRRVVETLRYRTPEGNLPRAEVVAVAVEARWAGAGMGRRLVRATLDEFLQRGTTAAKVVAGSENVAALALYASCGFVSGGTVAVHEGTRSEVLVWNSASP